LKGRKNKMECFTILSNEIEGRIDPHFYRTDFRKIEKNLKKSKTQILGDIASFQYGLGETAKEKGDVNYIRITDIDEFGNLKEDNLAYLDFIDKFKDYLLKKGDILVARTGATYGKSLYFDEDFKSVFAGYLIRIKLKKESGLNPKYLFYFMQTKTYWLQAKQIMTGGGQPQFNANTIEKLIIPIPSLATQNKIVSLMDKAYSFKKSKEFESQKLLDSINDFVLEELGIKLPELKDKMAYVVNSEEVKNNRADAYYFQPKFKEVEKAINKGKFEIKELKEITDFIPGYAFSSDDYIYENGTKLLAIKNIKENKIDLTDSTLLPIEYYQEYNQFQIKKGDIVIAMTGATIGKTFIFDFEDDVLLNQRVGILRPKNGLNKYFLLSFMKNYIFRQKIIRQSCGGAQPNISETEILSIKIPLPPLTVQNKIADEVKKRMQKAEQLKKEAKEELEKAKLEVEKIILS
jgi:restriction endonuclease S subunit